MLLLLGSCISLIQLLRNHLLSNQRARALILVLSLSIAYQISQKLAIYGDCTPILDWLYSFLGVLLMFVAALAEVMMLKAFQSFISITDRTIYVIGICWIFVFAVTCFIPTLWELAYLGSQPTFLLHLWYNIGTALMAASCSFYDAFQTLYLLRALYLHYYSTKDRLRERMFLLQRLAYLLIVATLLDWAGVVVFAMFLSDRSWSMYGALALCVHCLIFPVVFDTLRLVMGMKTQSLQISTGKTVERE